MLCKYDVFTTKARGIIKNLLAQNISFETNHTSTIVPIKASHITSGPHASRSRWSAASLQHRSGKPAPLRAFATAARR